MGSLLSWDFFERMLILVVSVPRIDIYELLYSGQNVGRLLSGDSFERMLICNQLHNYSTVGKIWAICGQNVGKLLDFVEQR